MAKEGDDLKAALFCIASGGALVFGGLKRIRRKRIVEDTPHIDIASAPQGLVEIQGFAWFLQGMNLTLRGRKAVYHHLQLQEYVKRGKNHTWVTRWTRSHSSPFYVIDSTGAIRVNPEQAELECKAVNLEWSKLSEPMRTQALGMGITASGFPPSSGFFGLFSTRFRFRESAILLGAPIYVYGTLRTTKADERLPPSLPLQRFRGTIGRIGRKSLASNMGFDRNRDGVVCEEEAALGTNEIGEKTFDEKLAYKETPPLPGEAPPENRVFGEVVSCEERKLYIADCHQEHLLHRIGRNSFLMVVGGALLMGLGAFILASKFLR